MKKNGDGDGHDRNARNVRNGARTAPAMDVSYLVDGVMDGVTNRGLNWDRIIHSPVPLKVVATSLDTLTPVVLEGPFEDVEDLKQCLKASAAVPVFAGAEPVVHRGQRLVDAAVMEPVPVYAAAADGCTHILVLCTRCLPRPPSSSSSSCSPVEGEGEGAVEDERQRKAPGRVRQLADAAETGRVGVDVVTGSGSSGVSAISPTLTTTAVSVNAVGERVERRAKLFTRVRNYIVNYRRRRRSKRTRRRRLSKAIGGILYKTVRGALLNPPHMKDAWGVADATRSLVDDDYVKDLDEALMLARDDPVGAAAAGSFPGGAHVYSISPSADAMPKGGPSSLCTNAELLTQGNQAGVEATNDVFSRVLACLEREEEVSYYVETMCERDFL